MAVAIISSLLRKPAKDCGTPVAFPTLRIHSVHEGNLSDNANISALLQSAQETIQDEIGKNNFVDTIADGKQLLEYPANTYVLKYATDDCLTINLYYVDEIDNGWILSSKQKVFTHLGQFSAVNVENYITDQKAAVTRSAVSELIAENNALRREIATLRQGILPVSAASTCAGYKLKCPGMSAVIDELKRFDVSSLRSMQPLRSYAAQPPSDSDSDSNPEWDSDTDSE